MCEIKLTDTIEKYTKDNEKVLINTASTANINYFLEICRMEQPDLKTYLTAYLETKFGKENVISGNGFVFAKGDIPVLLTAHMDTVHKEPVRETYEIKTEEGTVITSPQGIGGDDRCGIYMINMILEDDYKPYILFCEDEEIGGVGSNKFVKSEYIDEIKNLKFFIELDRAGDKDLVYYDCNNKDFQKFVEEATGYKTSHGSFSDISHLSPAADVASVNISCGYHRAHTTDEYVIWEEMENSIAVTEILVEAAKEDDVPEYDYQPYSSYGYGRYAYDFDDYYFGYGNSYSDSKSKSRKRKSYILDTNIPTEITGYFYYLDEEDEEAEMTITGDSELSCIAKFMIASNARWDDVLDYMFDNGF